LAANSTEPSAPVKVVRARAAITALRNVVAVEPAVAGGFAPLAIADLIARSSACALS
jgi:hypothetical protein